MELAYFGINMGACADPSVALQVARAAEEAGLESVWTGEHVVLPDPQVPPSPVPPETPFLDPAVALSFLAAATQTLRLGTGIIILPQRNPVVLAKELASVDVVSGGRLLFGVGVGYLQPEFAALGVPFAERGARTDEYLEAILALWTQPKPRYDGRFAGFEGIQSLPRPVQRPHPPLVIGGFTPPAFRRAILRGNGWYGFAQDLAATQRCLEGLRRAARECQRPAALGELEISITPRGMPDADAVKRYGELGVDRLIVFPPAQSSDDALRAVDEIAALRGAAGR